MNVTRARLAVIGQHAIIPLAPSPVRATQAIMAMAPCVMHVMLDIRVMVMCPSPKCVWLALIRVLPLLVALPAPAIPPVKTLLNIATVWRGT